MDVLVVEDEALIRLTLCDSLEDVGLSFGAAADATSALATLDAHGGSIAVLVTDVNLGPGHDGVTLAAEARRRLPGLRVVYATGNPESLPHRALEPWERLFVKPYDTADLAGTVCGLLQEAKPVNA